MYARVRRKFRITSFCLVAVAAWMSISASVPVRVALAGVAGGWAEPQGHGGVALVVGDVGSLEKGAARSGVCRAVGAPCDSVLPHAGRRIFVEDTTPSSSEGSQSERLEVPARQYARLLPAFVVFRRGLASEANRQRAP